jgi:hypothetical protein
MASKYDQLLQDFVNKSYEELTDFASSLVSPICQGLESISGDQDAIDFFITVIFSTMAVDGCFTELEYRFLNDVFNLNRSYDSLKEQVQSYYDDEWISIANQIVDVVDEDTKTRLITFCLCLAAIDEKISREENAFIQMLID